MASLLLTVGVLSYDQIKKQKAKRAAKKDYNSARFSALEAENARRLGALPQDTCFCQNSDWQGGECERHGYVPAAGEPGGPPARREEDAPPRYEEQVTTAAARKEYTNGASHDRLSASGQRQRPYGEIEYQY